MRFIEVVEALLHRQPVRVDARREVVVLNLGETMRARYLLVEEGVTPLEYDLLTLGGAVAQVVATWPLSLSEAFVVDALRTSETSGESSYLARALAALRRSESASFVAA